jgi:hypothetical protein
MANFGIQLLAGIPFVGSRSKGPFSWVAFGMALLPALVFLAFVIYFRWRRWREGAANREIEKWNEGILDRALAGDSAIEEAVARAVALTCLTDRRREVRKKAAVLLRDRAGGEVFRQVAERMKDGYHPERIAQAIADTAWSAMEPTLLPLLDGKKAIARAALEALGRVGGEATLVILQARDHRPELREARKTAIARLRERRASPRTG